MQLAHFLGDEAEEVDDELRLAGELLAQLRILRRDADRAGVEVADAHHDAARRRPAARWRSRTPRRRAARRSTTSRPVFSWPSTCTTMRSRRSFITSTCCVSARPSSHGTPACLMLVSGEAPVPPSWPRDQHDVGVRLGDAGGDRADADLGDQLHVDARARVGVLQVVDQLRQILDRVDVVVRRRRDQADARRRVADLGDPRVDLVAGQLAALAGLGALRHLDLQLVGVDQVLAGDAEAARGHLLDRAAPRVAVRVAACSAPGPRRLRRCSTLPPMRFMAMASVSCASWLIEP